MLKILFISEVWSEPFDEGIKNVAYSLHRELEKRTDLLTVTKKENKTDNLNIVKIHLNKLFLSLELRSLILKFSPNIIFYLPGTSLTFCSFIRAKVLKTMSRISKVVILGAQHRGYSSIQKQVISNILRPNMLLLLSSSNNIEFLKNKVKLKVLPPAVDKNRFYKATKMEKENIRSRYNMPNDKTIVLHVGHIRTTRNVEALIEVQRIDDVQVVVVDSTSTPTEVLLRDKILKKGIKIIDGYQPDIPDFYKMSDIYIFPVFNRIAAIDMPLSVIEAMSCNLPVISTRFGGLSDYFAEDKGLKYFNSSAELPELVKSIKNMLREGVLNDKKVAPFTWDRLGEEVITAFNEL
jgi:glycosyltransferase involved in cell wall biosynthesis